MMGSVRDRLTRLRRAYAPHEHRPLDGYVVAMGAFGALAASLAAAAKLTGRPVPERPATSDIVLISIATHKLSRLLAKDSVTSPLRAPFTQYKETGGPGEVMEEARTTGQVRHAIGELVTCPFCLDMWIATGFALGLVFAPKATRLIAATMAALTGADFLQLVYARAQQAAG
jgi:hypothetical protein